MKSAYAIAAVIFALPAVAAAQVDFTAEVDREEIAQDESIALKLNIRAEGDAQVDSPPTHAAPDFELVNEYTSTFIESYYENGRFGMRNTQSLTRVLRPKKTGSLRIDRIQVGVNGKTLTAPAIIVQVTAGGAGTPPPQGYGGGGAGLRGSAKRPPSGTGFFLRAEVDKQTIFKGEQLIVSYYLYRRVRAFNIQVDKYPVLNGFLREDLEIPVLGQRLDSENVALDGVAYERSLLARYAAYPLKEGKLPVDSMAIKANYYAATGFGGMDDEDPVRAMFQQLAPRVGTSQSDPLSVEVLPLPTEGRPASFTGGIGTFEVSATVDKAQAKTNEAITLTVTVQGKGNIAAIEAPKFQWPAGIELYESKAKIRGGRAGVGEKAFEFLLIPRSAGTVTIPASELAFFEPGKKAYGTRAIPAIQLEIAQGPGGSAAPAGTAPVSSEKDEVAAPPEVLRPLKSASKSGLWEKFRGHTLWRVLAWAGWIMLGALGVLLGIRAWKSSRNSSAGLDARDAKGLKTWKRLKELSREAGTLNGIAEDEVHQAYELICSVLYDAIDRAYSIGARSQPRFELKRLLTEERGLPAPTWESISNLLEFAETVRFARRAGAVTVEGARTQLPKWVDETSKLEEALRRGTRHA